MVTKGENNGKQLRHVNIVGALTVIPAEVAAKVDVPVPEPLRGKPMMLVVYCQQKNSLHITGAAQVKID